MHRIMQGAPIIIKDFIQLFFSLVSHIDVQSLEVVKCHYGIGIDSCADTLKT